mgnify:CR=1 FL=1
MPIKYEKDSKKVFSDIPYVSGTYSPHKRQIIEDTEKHTEDGTWYSKSEEEMRDYEDYARAHNRIYTEDGRPATYETGRAARISSDLFDLGNNIFDLASTRGEKYAQKSACSLCGSAMNEGGLSYDFVMGQELCRECADSGIGLMPF